MIENVSSCSQDHRLSGGDLVMVNMFISKLVLLTLYNFGICLEYKWVSLVFLHFIGASSENKLEEIPPRVTAFSRSDRTLAI